MQYSCWSIPKYLQTQNILEPVEGQGINFELFFLYNVNWVIFDTFSQTKSQKLHDTTYNSRIRQNVIILQHNCSDENNIRLFITSKIIKQSMTPRLTLVMLQLDLQRWTACARHLLCNLFVTAKSKTTSSQIYEFKVLHKDQRAF